MPVEFIELAGKLNQQMPYHCVAKLQRMLNERGHAVRGSRIAVLGVSYKPGVSDLRESPALKIIRLLLDLGAEVVYHDPLVAELDAFDLRSLEPADALAGTDLAVIVTAQPGFDYAGLAKRVPYVLDLRGVMAPADNVVRL